MGDRHLRPRSPPLSHPGRASAPSFHHGRYSDLHAVPTHRDVYQNPRHSGTSLNSGPVITHYKIKPEAPTAPPPDRARSGSRRSTLDGSSKPIIVTPTRGYNVVVGEPRGARDEGRERDRDRDEAGFVMPASSERHRRRGSEYRRGHFSMDEPELERSKRDSGLLRAGSIRQSNTYPLAGRPIEKDSIVRHPDTMKDDYGDDGYGYTNPRDMAEYDLDLDGSRGDRRRRRRESFDSRGGRPVSISGYGDISQPSTRREDRDRGPPPSTRGFDRIGDRSSMYAAPPTIHMPMPHEHITPSPLVQEPLYAGEIPSRRNSTSRRPVSLYHEPERRVRSDEYEMRDGEAWDTTPRRQNTYDDGIETRGFGIRTDLLSAPGVAPAATVTVQPPSARHEHGGRDDRADPRHERRDRDDLRYHDRERRDRDRDDHERRYEIDDRERDRERDRPHASTAAGLAAGAAAALGISAASSSREEDRKRDDNRDREHDRPRDDRERDRDHRRRRERDSEDDHHRRERRSDSPPVVDLKGRDPIERRSPIDTRDAETIQRELEQNASRRDSPLQAQDDKVDLTDRYPVIERNVAAEEKHSHYPDPVDTRRRDDDFSPRPSPRQDSNLSRDSEPRRGGIPRREKIYNDDRETAASPTSFNARDAADLRALRAAMNAESGSATPPRPPKEPLDDPKESHRLSRESTDRMSDPRSSSSRLPDPRASDGRLPERDHRSSHDKMAERDHRSSHDRLAERDPKSSDSKQPAHFDAHRPVVAERFDPRDTRDIAQLRAEISNSSTAATGTSSTSFDSFALPIRGHDKRDSSASPPASRSGSRERTSRSRSVTITGQPSNSLRVVSPPRPTTSAPPPPKGILKPSRTSWPEDPNPEREGVSLRVDAESGKNWDGREVEGVPKDARWTKISRRLVNPEALERGKERFEERGGSVIVLRVLTREEVEGYAVLTREIRGEYAKKEEGKSKKTDGKAALREDEERRERRHRGEETVEEREERRRRRRERHERRRREEGRDETEEDGEARRRRRERREREREEKERERERVRAKEKERDESSSSDSTDEERERERRERRRRRDRD